MDEKKCENISEDSRTDYRNKIVEMVVNIKNPDVLEYLHTFVCLFLEKWG